VARDEQRATGRCFVTGYGAVRVLLGVVLLAASAAKGYELTTEPIVETGWLSARWLRIAVVELELVLGLWLLTGLCPRQSWLAALGCFTVFLGVALLQASENKSSCCCFGRVLPTSPKIMLACDLAALIALVKWQPGERPLLPSSRLFSQVGAIVILALMTGIALSMSAGGDVPLLAPLPEGVDLGVVSQSGSREQLFWLVNPTDKPVAVATLKTGCPCLVIDLPKRQVAPAETVPARVVLDLGREPHFTGDLGIEVRGFTEEGRVAFVLPVAARVRPASQALVSP